MHKLIKFKLILLAMVFQLYAETLQDWSDLQDGSNIGTYADALGSEIEIERATGSSEQEEAIKVITKIEKWGGLWVSCFKDLSESEAIQFKAKATKPGLMIVQLHDSQMFRVITLVKIKNTDWQTFNLPISQFRKNQSYQDPSVSEDAVMDWSSVERISFDWAGQLDASFTFGPIQLSNETSKPQTGLMTQEGQLIIQDYSMYTNHKGGVFKDEFGSNISMNVIKDESSNSGYVASFKYTLLEDGWCGAWAESGHLWQGQNWQGAKEVQLRVYSEEALELEMAFNDKQQNAYVAPAASTTGIGWETISINFDEFALNEYYQPEDSNPGAELDLFHIKNFNLAPKTVGNYQFKVDLVALSK